MGLSLFVSCDGAVWAPLQSVLVVDQLPARAQVGMHMVISICLLLGFRFPALLAGLRGLFLFVFSRVGCVVRMLAARARVVVHRVISVCLRVWRG